MKGIGRGDDFARVLQDSACGQDEKIVCMDPDRVAMGDE
jgi:hypothetical protein